MPAAVAPEPGGTPRPISLIGQKETPVSADTPAGTARDRQELRSRAGAARRRLHRLPRRGDRAGRRQRRRQVDPGQVHQRHLPHRRRRVPLRRPAGEHPRPARRRRARHRGRLPGPRALRQPRHRAEHVPRAGARRSGIVPRRADDGADGRRDPGRPLASVRSSRCGSTSPASPAASARRWRSPRRCSGTASWSSSTSRPPRSASRRPPRCSNWSAGWRTTAWRSCSSRTT